MKFSTWVKRILIFLILFFIIDFAISKILQNGIDKYFGLNADAKILVNGSSMTIAGFNKSSLEKETGKKVAFYSRNGVSLEDRNAMLKHYYNTPNKRTEIAILEVNPLLFSKRFTAANVYMLFLPFMDDSSMSGFIKSKTDFKEFWIRKLIRTSRYNSDLISLSIMGYTGNYENKKNQTLDPNVLEGLKKDYNSVPVEFDLEKVRLFKETVELVASHSQKIILVNMPIYKTKMETFKKEEYQVFLSFIKQFSKDNKNLLYLDLNQGQLIKDSNLFSDPLHVNVNGQEQETLALTNFIKANQ